MSEIGDVFLDDEITAIVKKIIEDIERENQSD